MVLEFPVRARVGSPGEGVRPTGHDLPPAVRRRLPVLWWARRNQRLLVFGLFVFAVVAFSGGWTGGALVLDGPGISLYVRMALDHLGAERTVPYWLPDLWGGAPIWAVTPTLPIFLLLPLATAVGPDVAVKVGVLGLQVFGACGAYVLARSLWRYTPAALVAGILFALQPLVLSHGALAGSQPTVGVMAAAPWLVWALRKGLRGEGPGYLAVAGLLSGFAVLMQAEYAVGLALLCACLLAVEVGRVGTGRNPATLGRLLARGAAVVAVGLGSIAYWLLPFLSLGDSFILSPAELVQGELFNGSGAAVGSELGVFFGRSQGLAGAVGFNRQGLLPLFFHVGWVGLALALLSVALLARRDRDGTLTAIMLSATVGVWLSTGVVPLASGGPAARTQVVPFLIAGLATGLLLGALLRPLRLGRWRPVFVLGAVAFMAAVPYLTPFETLQKVIPLFGSIRFPRFYTVAPLALALGAAYPVVLAQEWAERRRSRSSPAALPAALATALALAVIGAFLVDAWPQRSYYRIRPPATAAAYREVVARLAQVPGDYRVAPTQVEATAVDALLDTGHPVTIGWPHFVAGAQMWRLTAEAFLTPAAYRERAWGLLATSFQVTEQATGKGTADEAVPSIQLAANPRSLPMVRTYSRTVAMATRDLTPELAIALAHRNVGVYTGSPGASPALAATTVVDVRSPAPCDDDSGARLDPALASQLGVACGLHAWVGTLFAGVDLLNVREGVGGTFRATTNRLQGISVYLDRPPDRTEVALYEVAAGGRSLGPALARAKAVGVDEYGMAAFTFDPVAASAGKEYAYILTCGDCRPERVPRMVAGHSVDRPGNLLVGGELRLDRAAAFAPVYEAVAADPTSATSVRTTRREPGRWRIVADGGAPALVVVAEAWFPGWEAKVDGRTATLVEADGGFLGVPVDAGSHVVTLEYHRPAAASLGRLVTFATLLSL
ncbi:MAG: YfhO family protein, partial [Acidimicrobiales bacterium]